jgi:hypothetical protein
VRIRGYVFRQDKIDRIKTENNPVHPVYLVYASAAVFSDLDVVVADAGLVIGGYDKGGAERVALIDSRGGSISIGTYYA